MKGYLVALAPPPLSIDPNRDRAEGRYDEAGPRFAIDYEIRPDGRATKIVAIGPVEVSNAIPADAIGLFDERGKLLVWWAMRSNYDLVPSGSTTRKSGNLEATVAR